MKRSPDIALFTRWIWGGGAERVMLNLAKGLAAHGLQVDLIILQSRAEDPLKLPKDIQLINFEIQPTTQYHWLRFPSSFQSLRSCNKLIGYLKQNQPRILISATHFLNEVAILARNIARVSTRVVVTEHTFLSQESASTEQRSSRLIPWTVRLLYPYADEVIAVSDGVANDLKRLLGSHDKSIGVIYNSVVLPEIYQLAAEPIGHPWFQNKELPIIVAGGRFVRQKDFPTLLQAFAQCRQTRPARLVLLGDGRELNKLRALIQSLDIEADVFMPGFVHNPYAFFKQADIFVLSSAWEGLPTMLIEAIALGTPAVSTDCPSGPAEILRGGRYGRLVPVGDPHALATAIVDTLRQPPDPVPEDWIKQFTPMVAIQKYLDITGLKPKTAAIQAENFPSLSQHTDTIPLITNEFCCFIGRDYNAD